MVYFAKSLEYGKNESSLVQHDQFNRHVCKRCILEAVSAISVGLSYCKVSYWGKCLCIGNDFNPAATKDQFSGVCDWHCWED